MFKRLFAAAIIFGVAALAPPIAQGQSAAPTCAARAVIAKALTEGYSEQQSAGGFLNGMQILEIWSSFDTGSWTALVTRADGISCIVASGSNWQQSAPPPSELDPTG